MYSVSDALLRHIEKAAGAAGGNQAAFPRLRRAVHPAGVPGEGADHVGPGRGDGHFQAAAD